MPDILGIPISRIESGIIMSLTFLQKIVLTMGTGHQAYIL